MIRTLSVVLALILLFQASASSQDTPNEPMSLESFFDPSSKQWPVMIKGMLALECAAMAERVNEDLFDRERSRLLTIGVNVISELVQQMSEIPDAKLPEPFDTYDELAAFAAGQLFGSAKEKLVAEYMRSPENDLNAFYRSRFEEENCFVVGR